MVDLVISDTGIKVVDGVAMDAGVSAVDGVAIVAADGLSFKPLVRSDVVDTSVSRSP